MIVRLLNSEGIREFEEYLTRLRNGATDPIPYEMLTSETTSSPSPGHAAIEEREFRSRHEAAKYLERALRSLPERLRDHDRGLWAWISLFYLDQICPADKRGRRKPGQLYRHIPSTDFRHYYRHLVLGPYQILTTCGKHGRCMLYTPFGSHGDLTEQLASRQEIIVNKGLMELVDRLYFDSVAGKAKPGATSRKRAGNVRRLVALMNQLDLTYDLYSMSADELEVLLPREYDTWRRA